MTFIPTTEPPTAPQKAIVIKADHYGLRLATVIALVAAITAAAAVALTFALQGRGQIATLTREHRQDVAQIRALSRTAANLETGLNGLASKQAKDYGTVNSVLVPLSQLATTTCSSDLTGPQGPAVFYFYCSPNKPASSG